MAEVVAGWQQLLDTVRRALTVQLDEAERQQALNQAMNVGCASLSGAMSCSITVQEPNGQFRTIVTHGDIASALDDSQYQAGDGPCLSAARHHRPVRIDEMKSEERWPQFSQAATGMGVRSSLSLPLADHQLAAALNFYGDHEFCFAAARSDSIARLVTKATTVLLNPPAAGAGDPRAPGDEVALHRLDVARQQNTRIIQARDLVMARDGLVEGAAFHQLALRSRDESRPLIAVAENIIETARPR